MADRTSRPRNRLVVGLQDNFGSSRQRSISPVGDVPRDRSFEMKDMSDTRFSSPNGHSEGTSDTDFSETPMSRSPRRRDEESLPSTDLSGNRSPRSLDSVQSINVSSRQTTGTDRSSRRSHFPTESESSDGEGRSRPNSKRPYSQLSSGHRKSTANSRETSDFGPISDFTDDEEDNFAVQVYTGSSLASERLDSGDDISDLEDYFCVDHMKLCSSRDLSRHHQDCENIVPAAEWADRQKLEKEKKTIEGLLKKYCTFADIMIGEREDLKTYLAQRKEEVTDDFLDLMEDMVTHILCLQKEFTKRFDDLHESKLKMISEQIKRCKMVQKETSTSINELAELTPGSFDYQETKMKVMKKGPVYEEILRRDFQNSTRIDYVFGEDPQTHTFMTTVTKLGDIVLRPTPSKLPGFLSVSKETDFSKRAVNHIEKHEGKHSEDENNCCFSGCSFISQGRIVLADWNNACLKLFSRTGVLVQRLPLPHNPWDVSVVDSTTVVVTVPSERTIFLVDCRSELEVISSFQTEAECYGIVTLDGKFAVTCDPWSKMPCVRIFSREGEELSFLQRDSEGSPLFRYPQHIATDQEQTRMFVSDARLNEVVALTPTGKILFRYTHTKLESPSGVACDSQGHLYVCGKDSSNVHQISKDGKFVQILLTADDELRSPRGVCFEPNGERILVTDLANPGCDEFLTGKLA